MRRFRIRTSWFCKPRKSISRVSELSFRRWRGRGVISSRPPIRRWDIIQHWFRRPDILLLRSPFLSEDATGQLSSKISFWSAPQRAQKKELWFSSTKQHRSLSIRSSLLNRIFIISNPKRSSTINKLRRSRRGSRSGDPVQQIWLRRRRKKRRFRPQLFNRKINFKQRERLWLTSQGFHAIRS